MSKWYERWITDPIGDVASDTADQIGMGTDMLVEGAGDVYNDISGNTAADAARSAAKMQSDLGHRGLGIIDREYQLGRKDTEMMRRLQSAAQKKLLLRGGQMVAPKEDFDMSAYSMPGEFDASQYDIPDEFSFTMDDYEKSPYAQFLQDEAMDEIQSSRSVRGLLGSGGTLKSMQDRAAKIASGDFADQFERSKYTHAAQMRQALDERQFGYDQHTDETNKVIGERNFGFNEYQDRVGRDEKRYADRFNQLALLSGAGQFNPATMANIGQQYGANAANQLAQIGQAQAGGELGAAQARQAGTSNLLNLGMMGALLW